MRESFKWIIIIILVGIVCFVVGFCTSSYIITEKLMDIGFKYLDYKNVSFANDTMSMWDLREDAYKFLSYAGK